MLFITWYRVLSQPLSARYRKVLEEFNDLETSHSDFAVECNNFTR